MKKIFGLLAMSAFALVACNPDTPEPEPVVEAPVVTLDKQSVEVSAEGGEFTVNYTIENPVEGVTLAVTEDVEWISDVEVAESAISFAVAANDVEKAREATLYVGYTGAEGRTIAVAQAAKSAAPTPELATITLEVENITWNNADVTVTPSEDVEYILGVMTKEAFAPYAEDIESLVAARVEEWQETAQEYQDMGYDDPWQYYLKNEQRSGERTYSVKYDSLYNMSWDTEYVVYCFGMNDEGVQTTAVAVAEFRTEGPEASDNTFTITIDAMTKSSVEFTIEPTTEEPYYVTIETVDLLAGYGPDQEKSYEDMVRYLTPEYDMTIEQRTFTGKQTISNTDINKSVNSFKTYKVVVWGFENGPTTDVYMSEEFAPADPIVDFEPSISIDKCNHREVIFSVVPNANSIVYYSSLHTADEVGEDGGQTLAEVLVNMEGFNANLSSGIVQKEYVVEPESEYYVVVFGYDSNTATFTSEVFLSERITTPAVPGEKPELDVEVTNLAWNGADIYVKPNNDFRYFYDCRTKAKFEERYGSTDNFYNKVYSGWESEASDYGYDVATVMGWYTNEGSGVADIGALVWSTDYIFAAFGVDDEGNLITDVVVREFTTLTPAQSSNEFTITINSMTKTSVDFTVTPTNNDQYYVTVQKAATVSSYGPDQSKSYDDLIAYLLPDSESTLNKRLFTGEQTITNSQLSHTVNGFSDYVVVVWGFDNGPTTTVFISEAFRPADPE